MQTEEARKKLRDMIFNNLPEGLEYCIKPDEDLFVIVDGVCFQIELHFVPRWKGHI